MDNFASDIWVALRLVNYKNKFWFINFNVYYLFYVILGFIHQFYDISTLIGFLIRGAPTKLCFIAFACLTNHIK